jgi:dipeptidyl aminopeptidase/acylaminoacyl peptidase
MHLRDGSSLVRYRRLGTDGDELHRDGTGSASGTSVLASPTAGDLSAFPAFDQAEALSLSEVVRFRGADGVQLDGRVFGSGDVGVVLAHMRPGYRSQWFGFAALLADQGYPVLTYDRRGVCPGDELGCSGGKASDSAWQDLAFAADLLRERGAARVVVGGASLGRWNRCTR